MLSGRKLSGTPSGRVSASEVTLFMYGRPFSSCESSFSFTMEVFGTMTSIRSLRPNCLLIACSSSYTLVPSPALTDCPPYTKLVMSFPT